MTERRPACNITFAIGGGSCSENSFVIAECSVFRINICGKNTPSQNCKPLVLTINDDTA